MQKLILELLDDADPFVRKTALNIAGSAVGSSSDVLRKTAALISDPDYSVALNASAAIARMGTESIPALTRILKTSTPARSSDSVLRTKNFAAWSLSLMLPRSIPALLVLLSADDDVARWYALTILRRAAQLDPHSFSRLLQSPGTMQKYVAAVLQRCDASVASEVTHYMADHDPEVRRLSRLIWASILLKVFDGDGNPVMFPVVPRNATGEASSRAEQKILAIVILVFRDIKAPQFIRQAAAAYLGKRASLDKNNTQILLATATNQLTPAALRIEALNALAHQDSKTLRSIVLSTSARIASERSAGWPLRLAALRVLSTGSGELSRSSLMNSLIAPKSNNSIRSAAVDGLVNLGVAGTGSLAIASRSPDKEVRYWGAKGLGQQGTVAALDQLRLLLDDPDQKIREFAASASRDIPALLRTLQGSQDQTLRVRVLAELAAIGPSAADAIPALFRIEEDPTESVIVRRFGGYALARIGAGSEATISMFVSTAVSSTANLLDRRIALYALRRVGILPDYVQPSLLSAYVPTCTDHTDVNAPACQLQGDLLLTIRSTNKTTALEKFLSDVATDRNASFELRDVALEGLIPYVPIHHAELAVIVAEIRAAKEYSFPFSTAQLAFAIIREGYGESLFAEFAKRNWAGIEWWARENVTADLIPHVLALLHGPNAVSREGAARFLGSFTSSNGRFPSDVTAAGLRSVVAPLVQIASELSNPDSLRLGALATLAKFRGINGDSQRYMLAIVTDPLEQGLIRAHAAVAMAGTLSNIAELQALASIASVATNSVDLRAASIDTIGQADRLSTSLCSVLVQIAARQDELPMVASIALGALTRHSEDCSSLPGEQVKSIALIPSRGAAKDLTAKVIETLRNLGAGNSQAVVALCHLFQSGDPDLRSEVAAAIHALYSPVRGFADFGERVRTSDSEALLEVSGLASDLLLDLDQRKREMAIEIILGVGICSPLAKAELEKAVIDLSDAMSLAAARALARTGCSPCSAPVQRRLSEGGLEKKFDGESFPGARPYTRSELLGLETTGEYPDQPSLGASTPTEEDLARLIDELNDFFRYATSSGGARPPSKNKPKWFPMLPPMPSSRTELDLAAFGAKTKTLADVYQRLSAALKASHGPSRGYETGLYRFSQDGNTDDGFAIVTEVERIHLNDLTPYHDQSRWTNTRISVTPLQFVNYLEELFLAPPGDFRMFVFIVTTEPNLKFQPNDATHPIWTEAAARQLFSDGGDNIPPDLGATTINGYYCHVLLYHIRKDMNMAYIISPPDVASADEHLRKTGILTMLSIR